MRVERSVTIRAPRGRVWKHLADPARYPRFVHAVTRWERAGPRRTGLGARYDIRFKVGAAHAGGLIEIVEYEPGWELAWTSITGIEHRGRWRIRDTRGGTRASLRLTYSTPGGIWGMAVDALSAPMMADLMSRSLQQLKRQVEVETPAGLVRPSDPLSVAVRNIDTLLILARAGFMEPPSAGQASALAGAFARWGFTPAVGYLAGSILYPDEPAIVDEAGTLSFREVERRTNSLARGLAGLGIAEGDAVAVLCRNHRGFVEATMALWKLGASAIYLNTSFAGPELADAVRRERAKALIHDAEFAALLEDAPRIPRVVAWEEGVVGEAATLSQLIAANPGGELEPPRAAGGAIVLTSGTTGSPKGAQRRNPTSLEPALALLSRIPLRRRQTAMIAAPLFHVWGFGNFLLSLLLSSTLVLQRRFDAEPFLEASERHHAEVWVAVPAMLQRILDLPQRVLRRYGVAPRVVAVSGSALPADLAERFMDRFGDVLYNLYGSTEVAWATIATPRDLREAPGTAGRPPRGTLVRIHQEDGQEALPGERGRIFVGNEMLFEGYTGGGGRDKIDGLMATGDLGRFDADGRLFVDGRSDDMIVSGGENVFPREVEDLLHRHPKVADVAVLGVPDERFGQVLKAVVVRRPQARLTAEQVRDYVGRNLALYKVPKTVEFVPELPRNPAGKVVKRHLASA